MCDFEAVNGQAAHYGRRGAGRRGVDAGPPAVRTVMPSNGQCHSVGYAQHSGKRMDEESAGDFAILRALNAATDQWRAPAAGPDCRAAAWLAGNRLRLIIMIRA